MKAQIVALLLACTACGASQDDMHGRNRDNAGDDDSNVDADGGVDAGPAPVVCAPEMGRAYKGFGGENLALGGLDQVARADALAGSDRLRMKPFAVVNATKDKAYTMSVDTVFPSEIKRVLGVSGNDLGTAAVLSAYGVLPDRWFVEPQAGAIPLYSIYVTAFKACSKYVRLPANTQYQSLASDPVTTCTALQRKAWNRTPIQSEIDACVGVAKDASNDVGTNMDKDNALLRWSYACAAVMTAEGFVTF